LHEARHCAASYLIAAGLNPKQLSVTSDTPTSARRTTGYGHLMPGDEAQAVEQLDASFARSKVAADGGAAANG
jgi:hypothetical protein